LAELLKPSTQSVIAVDASDHRDTGRSLQRRFVKEAAGYGIALFFFGAALLVSLALQRFSPYPFLFLFFAAVMAAAWVGGPGPGLFAVLLSTLAVAYYFIPPPDSFTINATDAAYFAAFVACAIVASWVSASKKANEQALREARDLLEDRVAKRTEELQKTNQELQASIEQREKAQQALIGAQADLARLARFLTMGELTASIAHEVNQPLTAIVTNGNACVEWLCAPTPNLDEAKHAAETIVKDGTRAAAVLGRVRALFRNQTPSRDPLDVNDAISELLALLSHEFVRNAVEVRTHLSLQLPRVRGDRVQLQQVLLNLIMNAIDAMKGEVEDSGRLADKQIAIRSLADGPSAVRVVVEDSGAGVDSRIADKIFEPLFTTKPQGIGMGLAIARSIIESHGGRLWTDSRPSGGAIFYFTIPKS
jgi:C4-dicarboxylate-specific signal transduction histidine kinase